MIYLLGLATMSLAWLLPGHDYPWAAFEQEATAGVGAALVALGAFLAPRNVAWRVPVPALLALLLSIVPPLQWATGLIPYKSDALLASVYLAGFGLAAIAGCRLSLGTGSFLPTLFGALAMGAMAAFGIGLAQWLQLGPFTFIDQLAPGARVCANFAQPNHLATLLGLGIVATIWAYEARRIHGWVACLGIAPLAFGLAMTQSRVGWLFVAALVMLWGAYRRRLGLCTPGAAVAAWVLLFALTVLAWPLLTHAMAGSEATSLMQRIQSGNRWVNWQTIWDAVLRSPWLGYGWNQVSAAQQAAVLDHPATFEWWGNSHNLLLDLLAWNGLPLGVASIGVGVWWAVLVLRGCAGSDAWALIAALAILLTHSMVEFPLMYAYFLLPAGLLVGALDARMVATDTARPHRNFFGRGMFAVIAVAVVSLSVAIADEYLEIDRAVHDLRFRDAGYKQGVEVPNVALLDGPREYVLLWATKNDDGDPGADIAWLRTVSQRFATPPALLRYAAATGVRGDSTEAMHTLQILCSISLPKYCDEGREKWTQMSERFPALLQVAFPQTPLH